MIPSTRELVFHKVLQMMQTKLLPSNSIRKQTWMQSSWIQDHPFAAAHIYRAYSSQYLQVPSWTQQFFRLKLYLTNCSAELKLYLSWERYGRHDRANKASRFCWSEHQRSCCDERCTQDVHMYDGDGNFFGVELWSSTLLRWKFDTAGHVGYEKSFLRYSNSVL